MFSSQWRPPTVVCKTPKPVGVSWETCESSTFVSFVTLICFICQEKLVKMLRGSLIVLVFLDLFISFQTQVDQLHAINYHP